MLFTITTPETADLLNGTLTIPPSADDHDDILTPFRDLLTRTDVLTALAVAFGLGGLMAIALRRRQPKGEADRGSTAAKSDTLNQAAKLCLFATVAIAAVATVAMAGPGHDHGEGGHASTAPSDMGSAPRKRPDGSVFVPKATQRLLEMRTQPATEQSAAHMKTLLGTIVSDPSALGHVQAPLDGQIEVGERGISYVGQTIQAGEVLALLTPSIPLADLGTMQQLRAEVDGKLIIAEQKLSRLTRIANVVAQRDIDDTRAELNALREQKRVLAPKGVEKIELKAPVSGVISIANVRAGQVVSSRDTLFEIVDPKRLWVEASGSNFHNDQGVQTAHAVDSDGHSIELTYIGRAPTLKQQSQPLLFRINEAHEGLIIGAPVKVLIDTPEIQKGIIVPDSAIVRGANGLQQVWIKTAPETFQATTVRVTPLDGKQSLALAGLRPGDRIVITGADLINQIR